MTGPQRRLLKSVTYDNGYSVTVVAHGFTQLECMVTNPSGHMNFPTLHDCWDEVTDILEEIESRLPTPPRKDR